MKTNPNEKRMPFLEHLRELRKRIIISIIAIVVGLCLAWAFHKDLFDWLSQPYKDAVGALPLQFHRTVLSLVPGSGVGIEPPQEALLRYTSPIEPFFVYLKTAVLAGVFLALPVIFWQLWSFISPGLYPKERRLAVPFVVGTTFFFALGAVFCRYTIMELAFNVLLSVGAVDTEPMIMMQAYFGLSARLIIVFGVAFELPILVMFLAILGIVTHLTLIKYWRFAVLIAFILSAILTPPDPATMVFLALPLCVLYALSIGIAFVFSRKRQKRMEGEEEEPPEEEPPEEETAG